jgi:hypothetical protein
MSILPERFDHLMSTGRARPASAHRLHCRGCGAQLSDDLEKVVARLEQLEATARQHVADGHSCNDTRGDCLEAQESLFRAVLKGNGS